MQLVAHVEGLGDDVLQIHAAHMQHGGLQGGGQHGLHPLQPLYRPLPVGAEPDHVSRALVDGGVGTVSVLPVFHLQQGHGAGDNTRHGAHRLVVVAGLKGDLARGGQGLGLLVGPRQTLIFQRAQHRAPHRAAHILPPDGGTGVKNGLLIQAEGLPRRHHVHPEGLRALQLSDRFFIGRSYKFFHR